VEEIDGCSQGKDENRMSGRERVGTIAQKMGKRESEEKTANPYGFRKVKPPFL